MATETRRRTPRRFHGGRLIARRLKAHGVSKLFTLSGGHLFSIYDGCREEGIDIVDVRHESTAAFAAEGWAKVTRETGVCALTAGPGVTNGMSAMASAQANHSPMVVLGGRAPAHALGPGLAAGDRPRAVRAPADQARRARPRAPRRSRAWSTTRSPPRWRRTAARRSWTSRSTTCSWRRPRAEGDPRAALGRLRRAPTGATIEQAGELLRGAERPVIMAGTDLYWGHGEQALLELAETLRIPVFLNGLARGCVPADHELFFSRARSQALKEADVALVIGVPMDFRLGFGGVLRRGHRDHRDRRGRARARAPAPARGRSATARIADDPRRSCARRRARGPLRVRALDREPAGRRERAPRGRAGRARATSARRCTRCASMRSSRRCSTATRS